MYALITGAAYVASGASDLALIIGGDANSRIVNAADDEIKIRQALARALEDEGHSVTPTGSPREALRLLNERPFIGDHPHHRLPRAGQDFGQAVADGGTTQVLVHSLAGTIGNRDDADANR